MKRAIIFAGLFLCCMYPATLLGKDKKTGDKVPELAANEAQLVVSADGKTKEEATKSALRSAIEQVCGAFVSSDTEILNDEIVKDEVVTISSGNIRDYKELACETLSNGNVSVTLQAIVNVSKIISYVQNKGATAEFAGATFAMNMQMYELNKRNEEIAMQNMFKQVRALYADAISYSLQVDTPQLKYDQSAFDLKIWVRVEFSEDALNAIYKLVQSTLYSLAMSQTEYENYKEMGLPMYSVDTDRVLPKKNLIFGNKAGYLPKSEYMKGKVLFGDQESIYRRYFVYRTDVESICKKFSRMLHLMLSDFDVISNVGMPLDGKSWYSYVNDYEYHTLVLDLLNVEQPYFSQTITIPKDEIAKYASFEVRKRGAH